MFVGDYYSLTNLVSDCRVHDFGSSLHVLLLLLRVSMRIRSFICSAALFPSFPFRACLQPCCIIAYLLLSVYYIHPVCSSASLRIYFWNSLFGVVIFIEFSFFFCIACEVVAATNKSICSPVFSALSKVTILYYKFFKFSLLYFLYF